MSEDKNGVNWRVMIVDDVAENLKLLQGLLLQRGYDVYAHSAGRMALFAMEKVQPDIILLDIDMPDMDLNIGVVNVPLIPEFGLIVGLLTVISAITVFFVIRRK